MKKIMIIGNAGNGKTTLAKKISAILKIQVFHLDYLLFKPGWERASRKEFFDEYNKIMQEDSWIIDGWGYVETLNSRIEAADLVIFIDFPIWFSCWRVFKRQIMYAFRSRPEFPENCPMLPYSIQLIKDIRFIQKKVRPIILELMDEIENQKFLHFTYPKEVENYLEEIT